MPERDFTVGLIFFSVLCVLGLIGWLMPRPEKPASERSSDENGDIGRRQRERSAWDLLRFTGKRDWTGSSLLGPSRASTPAARLFDVLILCVLFGVFIIYMMRHTHR